MRFRSCGDVIGEATRTVHSANSVYTYSVVKYFLVSGRILVHTKMCGIPMRYLEIMYGVVECCWQRTDLD